jgi:hypothetical protein
MNAPHNTCSRSTVISIIIVIPSHHLDYRFQLQNGNVTALGERTTGMHVLSLISDSSMLKVKC